MPRTDRRVADDYFSLEDMNGIMDGIAARRACASSAEPMTRPDYRAKKHSRPVRTKHERLAERRTWECVE